MSVRSRAAALAVGAVVLVLPSAAGAATTVSAPPGSGLLTVSGDEGGNAPTIGFLEATAPGTGATTIADYTGVNIAADSTARCTHTDPTSDPEDPIVDPETAWCFDGYGGHVGIGQLTMSLGGGDDQPQLERCFAVISIDLGEGANQYTSPGCPAGSVTNVSAGAGQDRINGSGNDAGTLNVSLGGGDDTFLGGGGASVVHGGPGNDTLLGAPSVEGRDTLLGEDGNDQLVGGAGPDILDGGNGDDELDRARRGAYADDDPGADDYRGGPGRDVLDFNALTSGASITLNDVADDGPAGQGDNVRSDIEEIHGTQYNDVFVGSPGPDTFYGYSGDDTIRGGDGNDTLDGESDNDQVLGEGGDDQLTGGYGNDVVDGGRGRDSMFGDTGSCDAYGCAAYNDTLNAQDGEQDSVQCGAGADTANVDTTDVVAKDGFQTCEQILTKTIAPPTGPQSEQVVAVRGKPRVSKGVRITVNCTAACSFTSTLRIGNKTARKYRIVRKKSKKSTTIGSRGSSTKKAGSKTVTIRLTKKARARLKRVRKISVTLSTTIKTKGQKKSRTVRKTVTLTR